MQAVEASKKTVISHGRLWESPRSAPMVGSAVARLVLSIAPMNNGNMAPTTTRCRSLWVSGLAALTGASMLVSRFRSSHHCAATSICELRNRRTQQLIELVWLWFRSPHFRLAEKNDADF